MNSTEAFNKIDVSNYTQETKLFILSVLDQLEKKNGDITDVDLAMVKIAGADHNITVQCGEVVAREGVTSISGAGNPIKHPALCSRINTLNSLRGTLRDLGLMGVSRRQAPAPNLLADSKILEALSN